MSAENSPSVEPIERKLPDTDLVVDFGEPVSGIAYPMPPERRAWYAERQADARRLQKAGSNMADILSRVYDSDNS